jgi:hypothetical protein
LLFSNNDLSGYLRMKEISMFAEIDGYGEEQILNIDSDQLCEYCENQYSVLPLLVRYDDRSLNHTEANLQYSPQRGHRPVAEKGTIIAIDVPFEGPSALLFCIPSSQSGVHPEAEVLSNSVDKGILRFSYRLLPSEDPKVLNAVIERDRNNLEFWVTSVNRDVEAFNQSLRKKARDHIAARKERLLKARQQIEALGIPLARRADAPKTYVVPDVRRRASISKPQASDNKFISEPTLADSEYEHILEILSLMARSIECSPRFISTLDEESLRTLFLVQLNAQYEGRATGETFNLGGKTDILIAAEHSGLNGHVFIAECKFWDGPKTLTDAIDQLLGYGTWRDTKTAVILFNRNKGFSSVLANARETAIKHPCFERELKSPRSTEFRFVFHRPDDSSRHFKLAVLVFDVPMIERSKV